MTSFIAVNVLHRTRLVPCWFELSNKKRFGAVDCEVVRYGEERDSAATCRGERSTPLNGPASSFPRVLRETSRRQDLRRQPSTTNGWRVAGRSGIGRRGRRVAADAKRICLSASATRLSRVFAISPFHGEFLKKQCGAANLLVTKTPIFQFQLFDQTTRSSGCARWRGDDNRILV